MVKIKIVDRYILFLLLMNIFFLRGLIFDIFSVKVSF